MKPPRKLLKVAVAGCSALLIAGFVSYRAGAFDSYLRPAPAVVEPKPESGNETPSAVLTPAEKDAIFSSSKSIILTPVTPTPPGGSTALPGSKSAAVFAPELDIPVRKPAPKAESPAPASPPK